MSDDDTAFDNWAHDNVTEAIYAHESTWGGAPIPQPSDVRELLREAFIAGIEYRDSQLLRMLR